MGCVKPAAPVANSEPGRVNHLLALKAFNPPLAEMLSVGYRLASATPTRALAATRAISLLRTSGRRLTMAAGMPVGRLFHDLYPLNCMVRVMAPGRSPLKIRMVFSW